MIPTLTDMLLDYIEELESQLDIDPDTGLIESEPYIPASQVAANLKRMIELDQAGV